MTDTIEPRRRQRGGRRYTLPEKADPQVKRLFQELIDRDITLDHLYAASGVEESTVRNWRKGASPRLSLIEACFNVVGMTLQPVDISKTNQN